MHLPAETTLLFMEIIFTRKSQIHAATGSSMIIEV
jgi:hypothetical protein